MDLALVGLVLPGVPNLSLACLRGAARRAGFEVRTVPFSGWGDMERALGRVGTLRPRVVGISIQTTEVALASLSFARLLRGRGFGGRIVVGGHFATLNAEEIVRSDAGVDAAVRFAGEEALVGMLRGATEAELLGLPGVVVRDRTGRVRAGAPPQLVDVRGIARPEGAHLPEHLGFRSVDLMVSRGCEHRCAYCCVAATSALAARIEGAASHARLGVGSIAEEMSVLYRDHGARVFNFMDDNLLPDGPPAVAKWARSLRDALDARSVPTVAVSMQLRADAIDRHSAAALARLGLGRAYVGIDGWSDWQLRVLGRRSNASAGDRAVRLLAAEGVFPVCNALLLGPTVPFDALRAEVAGLAVVEHAPVHLLPIDVRSGTTYHRRAERRGLLEGGFLWRRFRFEDVATELAARVLTSLPSRLHERSVPIGLYDLAYNLGIAVRLVPGVDVRGYTEAYFRIAREWNADQVRVLRAAIAAAESGHDAVAELIARERPRVRAFDAALLRETDELLVALGRRVGSVRRVPVASHARGRMLSLVAASMALVGCARTPPRSDDGRRSDAAAIRLDASIADARADATVPDAADLDATVADPPDGDAGCAVREHPVDEDGCLPFCADGPTVIVHFDSEGRATRFELGDGGALSAEIAECLSAFLAAHCYPSLAGRSAELSPHCWIA
jgi:hypothetical protein